MGWSDSQIAGVTINSVALCIAVATYSRRHWIAFTRCKDLSSDSGRLIVDLESRLNAGGRAMHTLFRIKTKVEQASTIKQRWFRPCTCEHRLKDCVEESKALPTRLRTLPLCGIVSERLFQRVAQLTSFLPPAHGFRMSSPAPPPPPLPGGLRKPTPPLLGVYKFLPQPPPPPFGLWHPAPPPPARVLGIHSSLHSAPTQCAGILVGRLLGTRNANLIG